MAPTDIVKIVVGVVGVFATYAVASPGEHILSMGVLRFDPALAAIWIFVFSTFWGIASSVRRVSAFRDRVDSMQFTPTEITAIFSLSLAAGATTYLQTTLTGVSLVVNVVGSILLTAIVITGGLVLFQRLGWGHLGTEPEV